MKIATQIAESRGLDVASLAAEIGNDLFVIYVAEGEPGKKHYRTYVRERVAAILAAIDADAGEPWPP